MEELKNEFYLALYHVCVFLWVNYSHQQMNYIQFHSPFTDVALSSGLLCHDPNSTTQGCCSDGAVLLGGFGGPLNPNLTVSSVEYLGPEEEHPPSGRTISCCTQWKLINGYYGTAKATDEGEMDLWSGRGWMSLTQHQKINMV